MVVAAEKNALASVVLKPSKVALGTKKTLGRAYLRIFTLHVMWVCNTAVISFANPERRRKGAFGEVVLSVKDVPEHLTTF